MLVMADASGWREIEVLYRADFPRFVRVAQAVTGNKESALEAVQEGFADALRNAAQYDGRGPLAAWVWRCVVNRARKAARPRDVSVWNSNPLNGEGEGDEFDLRVRLATLPERQRIVVFLRYFADLEYREIASALGIEVGTVSATLHSAHAALREALEGVRQ
jgi:RNA polymerase sigma factor (sigma-70 family)